MTALPPPTAEVARLVQIMGAEGALALIEWQAAARYYVPKTVGADHPLAQAVGLPAAQALVSAMGSEYLKVPIGREWRIMVYRARGMSYAQIGKALQISQNKVWSVLNKHELTASQLQLDF